MTPEDIVVVTVDGFVHQVTSHAAIPAAVQDGPVDEEIGRLEPTTLVVVPTTRYVCGCGFTIDAADSELDVNPRWAQGSPADCPNGC